MLDPLTSLSLAANVIQFVDFMGKIVSYSREIQLNDATKGQEEAKLIANDAFSLSTRIKDSIKGGSQNQDEQNLLFLSEATLKASQDLLGALNIIVSTPSLGAQPSALSKLRDYIHTSRLFKWKAGVTLYKALKAVMGKSKLEELQQRLVAFRSEIEFHILIDLREATSIQQTVNDKRFEKLDANIQCIMKTILTQHDDIFSHIQGHFGLINMRHDRSDALLRLYGDQILRAIADNSYPDNVNAGLRRNPLPSCFTQQQAQRVEQKILNELRYRGIGDRHSFIKQSHEQTFDWALSDNSHLDKHWTNLVQWLRSGSGCYWINGKAASGKSTLIKFISSRIETVNALKEWVGNKNQDDLLIAQFYFWHLGSRIQKSQEGLLRSLLGSLLWKYTSIIRDVLPEYWNELLDAQQHAEVERPKALTFLEVKVAFMKAISLLPPQAKVCFYIDGLDEYSGDHLELCTFLRDIVGPQVKLVVASRPLQVFKIFFKESPGLRLQDLTHDDITNFVDSELGKNDRMRRLRVLESDESNALTEDIVSRSSGVFLWVILVVKNLLRELNNFGRVEDLRARLEQYPEELDDLYRHMMEQMEPLHRHQASAYLQIVWQATRVQTRWPLTLEQMFFADTKDPSWVLARKPSALSNDLLYAQAEEIEGRLNSRCCGLIEAVSTREASIREKLPTGSSSHPIGTDTSKPTPDLRVIFFHKSVVDFLEQSGTWKYIVELTDNRPSNFGVPFESNSALMSSCLAVIKAHPLNTRPPFNFVETPLYSLNESEQAWFKLRSMIRWLQEYADAARKLTGRSHGEYKRDAHNVIFGYMQTAGAGMKELTQSVDWDTYDITAVFDGASSWVIGHGHQHTAQDDDTSKLMTWPC